MAKFVSARRLDVIDPGHILGALADPVLVVDASGHICFANPAAEQFFDAGSAWLRQQYLSAIIPFSSPLLELVHHVQTHGQTVSEYGVDIGSPRIGLREVNVLVSPVLEVSGCVVVQIEPRTIAEKMDRQLLHRGAARSISGMAAVLAHEVKNPLSGIRGAAQLLEQNVVPRDRELTRLICEEADRICALVDRVDIFSDEEPIAYRAVNIHEVLEHVRKVAKAGFARGVRFTERYDPSLPPVFGNRDQLIQVFLNLVKNAAEVVEPGGEITLATAYRHGVKLAVPGSRERVHLPLEVSVQDDGPGVPEDLKPHLFDPFVSTKANGTGLGLALVAKIVGDHGGVVECESRPRRTIFRVLLPVSDSGSEAEL